MKEFFYCIDDVVVLEKMVDSEVFDHIWMRGLQKKINIISSFSLQNMESQIINLSLIYNTILNQSGMVIYGTIKQPKQNLYYYSKYLNIDEFVYTLNENEFYIDSGVKKGYINL